MGVWCSVAGLFCYYPGSGFAGGTAGRPAPAAVASGASGLGAAPQAPAIYAPKCMKGQVEPKPLSIFERLHRFHSTVSFNTLAAPLRQLILT